MEKAKPMKTFAAAFAFFALLALAGSAAAQDGAADACPKKVTQACAKIYRLCLSSCTPDAGLDQDECRYRCCEDNRACLVGGNCSANECGG